MPASVSSPISRRISAWAPTSMPRVGSSRIRKRGFIASQRASTTFCWLPPERSPTAFSASDVRMSSLADVLVGQALLLGTRDRLRPAAPGLKRQRDVLPAPTGRRRCRRSCGPPARSRSRRRWPRAGCRGRPGASASVVSPRWVARTPNITSAVSVRPEPSRPASPITSPSRTVRSNGSITPRRPSPRNRSSSVPAAGPEAAAGSPLPPVPRARGRACAR